MPLWDKRRNFIILAGLVSLHVILISLHVPRGSEKTLFERTVFFVFSPIQRVVTATVGGIGSVWKNYVDLRGVRIDNEKLRKEMFFLSQDNRFLQDRLAFFKSEAQVLEILSHFQASIITARVIGVDPANTYRSVILDKGSQDRVAKDMAVCDRFGNLVGRTIQPISSLECTVQLITDGESSVSVMTASDRTIGILSGRSEIRCSLKYVLSSAPGGKEMDDLVTTGFDKIYPAGIRVGHIVKVSSANSIFKTIEVLPYFSFSELGAVGILPPIAAGKK